MMTSEPTPTPNQTLFTKPLDLLQRVSLDIAQANDIDTAFLDVLSHICQYMSWPLGHVYVWSDAAKALVSRRSWYADEVDLSAPLRDLVEGAQLRKGDGILARLWESGEPILFPDLAAADELEDVALSEGGIQAYFAFPIEANGRISAVIEFFSDRTETLDGDLVSIVKHVCLLLGLAIERQTTLTRLRQSETQLAEAQRTAHIGHWEWDVLTNQISWSSELYRIFGLSPKTFDATYEAYLEQIHPDDLAYVRQKVDDAYQHGRAFDHFHRVIRSDGAVRVLHARGRPIYDQVGSIIKLYGTAQDMTEQKEAELKLAQTVRQLSALMDIGQSLSATLDVQEVYRQVLTLVRPLLGAEMLLLFLQDKTDMVVSAQDDINGIDMSDVRVPFGSGIVNSVWGGGDAILLKGEACHRRLSPELVQTTGYRPNAVMAAPIRWRDQEVGVLEATHLDSEAFDEDDLRVLEMAATWAAIAVGNARQYEQIQRRLAESDALFAITNALTETLEMDKVLQLIVEQAQRIIPSAEWSTIHLSQPKLERLELAASTGLDVISAEYSIPFGQGFAGRVMAEGGVVNVANVQADDRRLPIDQATGARAMMVAPVESRLRRIGAISVQCATPNTFDDHDERLLKMLGVQAGMAIENARLYAAQRTARRRAEKQRERMRHMARRVVEAQEEERTRIARELHDESGQSLTSLKISLDLIRMMLPEELTDLRQSLDDVLGLTDTTMSNLRLLSHNLRPPGLDAYGLDAALQGFCQDFQAHTALSIAYDGQEVPDLAPLPALSLYRFAQEAMTNVAKHAEATQVQVTLRAISDMIELEVADNGRGFTPPNLDEALPVHGAGLVGMVERLEMVNGRLRIDATPGKGSRLTAIVPYQKETP